MEIILASVGILFALGAAITASVGSGIAAPLVPGYAQKVRHLVRVLEPFVRTQSKFVDYLLKSLEKTGSLERKGLDTELYVTLKSVRDASHDSHNKLNEIELLNFDTEAETAARASIWLVAAVVSHLSQQCARLVYYYIHLVRNNLSTILCHCQILVIVKLNESKVNLAFLIILHTMYV